MVESAISPSSVASAVPERPGVKPRVLYVDDEVENLRVFKFLFREWFTIGIAASGAEGLALLERESYDVIISDQRMPQMTGVDFLAQVVTRYPDTMRMILTGYSDISAVISAINHGKIYFYLEKPWKEEEIRLVVGNAVEVLRLRRSMAARDRQLEMANVELERRVEERTEALAAINEELRRNRDAAEAATRAKSAFLSTMSHEIRTPLNGVLGMSELLAQTELSAEQRSMLDVVRSSGESLLAVISDILDFSKIEAGRAEVESIAFSLHELLAATLQGLQPQAVSGGIELELDMAAGLSDVRRGDPAKLRQVLTNLVGNAIKFTSEGRVTLHALPLPSGGVRLEVSDTGMGIAQDVLPRLFSPFMQADSSTSRQHGGTGLGLAICSRLVELMGGNIGVTSTPGRGSTFWVELPLIAVPSTEETRVGGRASPYLPTLGGKRVLVAEHSPSAGALTLRMLLQWGVQGVLVDRPEAVLVQLAEQVFDAVIFDALLPGINGWEFAERLGTQYPRVPVIMTTAAGLSIQQAKAEHIRVVLQKPLRPELLHRALAEHACGWTPDATLTLPPRSLRVLLVEDNMINQTVASTLLSHRGHQVVHAINGQLALDMLERGHYDVVLMDVQMPEMDGLEATRRQRLREKTAGLRHQYIVAMTAGASESDREACRAAGMDSYISKPFRPHELFHAVETGPLASG